MSTGINIVGQATLVSGTNIKTINSNSLLGSGDLVVGGAGSGSSHVVYGSPGGNQYSPVAMGGNRSFGNITPVAGTGALVPFTPRITFTASSFTILTNSGTGTNSGQLVIYSNPAGIQYGTSVTATKVHQVTLNITAVGLSTVLTTFQFIAGNTYWLGYATTAISGTNYNLLSYDTRVMLPVLQPVGGNQYIGHNITGISGSTIPTTIGLTGATVTNSIPFIWFTVGSTP